jgi:hypothetical protein
MVINLLNFKTNINLNPLVLKAVTEGIRGEGVGKALSRFKRFLERLNFIINPFPTFLIKIQLAQNRFKNLNRFNFQNKPQIHDPHHRKPLKKLLTLGGIRTRDLRSHPPIFANRI